jgi:hypothetical protein
LPAARWGHAGAVVLAGLVICTLLCGQAHAQPAPQQTAIFEWSMPSNFGTTQDDKGRIVETQPDEVRRGPWRVDFEVTGLACQGRSVYRWTIAGKPVELKRVGSCTFQHWFPAEGSYPVRLDVRIGHTRLTQTQTVVVQNWLIVSIGDSVASGEAVPDIPHFGHAVWQSERCHRSARSGTAKAAKQIEDDDVHSSVTFVHLACSGATIDQGLIRPYDGVVKPDNEPPLEPQLDQLNQVEERRPIDAVLISVGANDVHFGDIARFCAFNPAEDCFERPFNGIGVHVSNDTVEQVVKASLASLPGDYDSVNKAIPNKIPRSHIHIVEYFDPTHDQNGDTCSRILGSITKPELELAQSEVLVPLDREIAAAADRNNWDDVSGVAQLFRTHGYCAHDQAWVTTATRSFQGLGGRRLLPRFLGTLHPNEAGHAATAQLIAASLEHSFFPGQFFVPRAEQPPADEDGGLPDFALVAIGAGGALLLAGAVWLILRRQEADG